MEHSAAGVFAGGDAAFGSRNIIDAVANGKRAALSIDEFLRSWPLCIYRVLDGLWIHCCRCHYCF